MATPVTRQPFKSVRPANWALDSMVVISLLLLALPSYAQQPASWEHCAAQFVPQELLAIKKAPAPVGDSRIYISADNASIREQEYFNLHGDVEIQQGDFIVRAEHMDYQRSNNLLNAQGNVRFDAENLIIVGEKATMAMGQYQGSIESSQVWLEANHLRGEAQRLDFLDKNRVNLHKALITSCNLGQDDWLLKASELRLDSVENEAVAKHARLELLGVPVLYSPYLSFPISGRKSGFLAPDMGISNKSGFELGLPYYWNIAPHRDATITPYYYDKRGAQLKSEFRYLNRYNRGSVYGEYLPKDKIYDADRGYAFLQHSGELFSGLSTSLEYRYVSDKDYLNDFGGQLGISSLTHLERYLNFDYRADKWRAKLFVQSFQTLDDSLPVSDQPYRRLPQIRFDTLMLSAPYGFFYKLDTELVNFYREDSLTARRVDLLPMLQWQQRNAFGYVRPKLSYRHTRYSLEKNHPDTDSEPIRSVPTFSFDSGLFFDRATTLGSAKVHTLEPRLFYLYVPYREQSNLVVDEDGNEILFDSGTTPRDFSQLFRDHRYTGVDRIGDTNQLSLALTSNFLNDQGMQLLSASIGQIYYFQDRKVTLPGEAVQTAPRSDVVMRVQGQWNPRVTGQVDWFVDDDEWRSNKGSFKFRYKPDKDRILALAYRYEKDAIEQADATVLWPLHRHWQFVASWQYSLFDNRTLENVEGLEYDSCCWALRLVHRRYFTEVDQGSYHDSVMLQLELKGLANVGSDINRLFTEGILD